MFSLNLSIDFGYKSLNKLDFSLLVDDKKLSNIFKKSPYSII